MEIRIKIAKRLIYTICIILCVLLLPIYCTKRLVSSGLVSHQEIARETSPDGTIDAISVLSCGSATDACGVSAYIVEKGEKFDNKMYHDDAVFFAYRAYEGDVKIYWKNDNLYVQYSSGVELRKHKDYYGNYAKSRGHQPIIHVYTEPWQS